MKLKHNLTEQEIKSFELIIDKIDECKIACEGGYPSTFSYEIPNYVVIASTQQDVPQLAIFKIKDLKLRLKLCKKMMQKYKLKIADAWFEAETENILKNKNAKSR